MGGRKKTENHGHWHCEGGIGGLIDVMTLKDGLALRRDPIFFDNNGQGKRKGEDRSGSD